MERKKLLRAEMKNELSSLSMPLYEDMSYQIALNLYDDEHWKEAAVVGVTISRYPEVDTLQIIRRAWSEGKHVCVPKCLPVTREMSFRKLTRFSQLESVYSGLFEPVKAETVEIYPSGIDLLIVPGLSFTKKGYRLGFGGGYYDRFLTGYKGRTVSLAFEMQIVPELPVESHDIPVSKLITEKGVFRIGS
ncbi:5-formyltetrahydrofolate cyclo-ligase [Bacillus sp. T33-2]|uniref:5-formyltetrahydrofolate cyclo-ligase n=1 Tax=Bacillus sp. T33-2 TaxID=2054168 RepID=UPI000C75ED02|nr:5-formyltetrahydrofolate cyclo-ligase [Bacillus sp. T33-2]PLR89490.1 5-formyltetrahydrofolate cyclo-ligase [Bacillus sp. T33-2]